MKVLAFYFLMLVFGTFAGVGWFNNRRIPFRDGGSTALYTVYTVALREDIN